MPFAVDDLAARGGDAPHDRRAAGTAGQRARNVAPSVSGSSSALVAVVERPRLVGAVEAQLERREHGLGRRRRLEPHVRPAVGRAVVVPDRVQREVEQDEVGEGGRPLGQRRVVGELGQRDERGEVLLVVGVGVPLAEAVAGLLVEPLDDRRRGPLAGARRRSARPR